MGALFRIKGFNKMSEKEKEVEKEKARKECQGYNGWIIFRDEKDTFIERLRDWFNNGTYY